MPKRKSRWESPASRGPYYPLLHLLFDTGAVIAAWYLSREARLLLNPYMALDLSRAELDAAAPALVALVLLWLLTATERKMYSRKADDTLVPSLLRVTEAAVVVNCITVILTFVSRHFGAGLSRSFILLFGPISFLLLIASLFAAMAAAQQIERRWPWRKRIAVLGFGRVAQDVVEAIRVSAGDSASLRGLILPELALAAAGSQGTSRVFQPSLPVLGTTRDLAEVINRESLDRIIVACDTLTEREVERCGRVLKGMGVIVSRPISTVIPGVQVSYQNDFGLHLVDLQPAPFTAWQEMLKRGMDISMSLAAIMALSPLLLAIACLIRLTSRGPVLYRSQRVGKGGRYFSFWKFRSMYCGAPGHRELADSNEASGPFFKIRRDPRITPLGRVLRRFSLDELPQLFNVLAGDMSLVGPRPLPAEDLDPDGMSKEFRDWAEQRALVRPGITGMWQVRGRSDIPFSQIVELDLQYIRKWSLSLDFSILLETPRAVISGRGAY